MACSRRRLIKSGCWGGQKWAFPVPVLDKHSLLSFLLCSFLQWFSVCCPIPLLSVPWLLCPVPPPHRMWAELRAQHSAPLAETQEGLVASQGRKTQEPADSLPHSASCLVFPLCATRTVNNLSPSLFVSLPPSLLPHSSRFIPVPHLALPLFYSSLHQKVTGPAAYIANSSYYRVSYKMTCKCVRFVIEEMNEFMLIVTN